MLITINIIVDTLPQKKEDARPINHNWPTLGNLVSPAPRNGIIRHYHYFVPWRDHPANPNTTARHFYFHGGRWARAHLSCFNGLLRSRVIKEPRTASPWQFITWCFVADRHVRRACSTDALGASGGDRDEKWYLAKLLIHRDTKPHSRGAAGQYVARQSFVI